MNTDEKVKEVEYPHIAGGTTKWFRQFGSWCGILQSYVNINHMMEQPHSLMTCLSGMKTCVHTNTCTQCLKQTYPSSSKLHPHNRILLNNNNDPTVDASNNLDASQTRCWVKETRCSRSDDTYCLSPLIWHSGKGKAVGQTPRGCEMKGGESL